MRLLVIACGLLLLTGCHDIYQLRKAAVKGDPEAQYEYGRRLLTGQKGAIHSSRLAFKWFSKAASNQHPKAMSAMGLCYERGLGVQRSVSKARSWYAAAVDAGNDDACQTLVQMEARAGNMQGALQWLERMADVRYAAMQGNGEACLMLSTCYATGKGVPKDESLMMGWLVNAAEAGNQAALGLLQQTGKNKK